MDILHALKIIVAFATVANGLYVLLRPRTAQKIMGLNAPAARGITELRAVLGGGLIGLGIAPLLLGTAAAYQMLGIMYAGIGGVRAVSMVSEGSWSRSNVISLVSEIVFGVILVLYI